MKDIKVYLFGSSSIGAVPEVIEEHLSKIIQQSRGHVEFLVGDSSGADSALHLSLSRVGAQSLSTIYCMDFARNNKFDFKIKTFEGKDEEGKDLVGRELYEIKDRHMIEDCDFAIALWDKKTKGTFNNINILKAKNKPVYIYTFDM